MKRLAMAVMAIMVIMIVGCTMGQEITQSENNQMMAYFAGRGFGAAISEWAPNAVDTIEVNWANMMSKKNPETGLLPDPIPPDYILDFFNSSVDLIKLYYPDPYALTSDLKMALRVYGGHLNDEGKLIDLQPIPRLVMDMMAEGWNASRSMAVFQQTKSAGQ